MHPDYSVDACGTIAEHCRKALERELGEICFTTHFDADPAYSGQEGWVRLNGRLTPLSGRWLGAYHDEIARAREEFGSCGLVVRAGLEVDYFGGVERALIPVLERFPFDFLIGSVHRVGGYLLSSRVGASAWLEAYGIDEGVGRYCVAVAEAAGCGLFDCLGHLEVYHRSLRSPARTAPMRPAVREAFESALTEAVRTGGVGLEINTRGAGRGGRPTSPGPEVLRMARRLGLRVLTVGSDAHSPDQVGEGLDAGLDAALAAGFREYCTFEGRKATARMIRPPDSRTSGRRRPTSSPGAGTGGSGR